MNYPWHIFGHKRLISSLDENLAKNSVSHTTLLVGPRKIGKFSILKRMAQFLQSADEESYDCKTCRQIQEDAHIDTIVYKRDGNELGIKDFRRLKEVLHLSPQAKYKIVIIQDIERLSIPLLNAMLKILEEPPKNALFFLTCSDSEQVPETIVSRARTFVTGTATDDEIRDFLEKSYGSLNQEFLEEVVFFSAGRIGAASEIVENSELHQNLVNWLSQIRFLHNNANDFEVLKFAEEISELEKEQLLNFLNLLVQFYRREMLLSSNRSAKHSLSLKLQKCMETIDLIKKNVNVKIALEVLFLHCNGTLGSMQNH